MKLADRRIRVMHVTNSWTMGGTERMLAHLLPNCDEQRFESRLVCMDSPSYLTDEWKAAGIDVLHLNAGRSIGVRATLKLRREIMGWRPDIVFTYGQRVGLMARAVKLVSSPFKLIAAQRGVEDWKRRHHVLLERFTSPLVDLYISNSVAGYEVLARRERIPRSKVTVIPNGVHFDFPVDVESQALAIRQEFGIPGDAFIIGTVGRILPVKGHRYLVEAIPHLLKSCARVFCVIVGEDRSNGDIPRLAKELEVDRYVLFPGYRSDIPAWHCLFDLFVLPSLSEGQSVAAIEAMFAGKPVVATVAGGTGEVVENGVTGVLVAPGDSEALAEAILTLFITPTQMAEMGAAGRKRAEEHFSLLRMVKAYEDSFARLVHEIGD